MGDKPVYIPCRLDRRDAKSAQIDDADGWPRKVVGPLGRVGKRLVVAATWLREAAGRHRVRFADGAEVWVTYGPGDPKEFVPLGHVAPAPVAAGSVTAPLLIRA
jgi:hypothetical protein